MFFLFSFPKDTYLKKKWLIAVKRKNFNPGSGARLCSKHFTKDQFQLRPNVNFLLIKPGAVPSIFIFPTASLNHFQKKEGQSEEFR